MRRYVWRRGSPLPSRTRFSASTTLFALAAGCTEFVGGLLTALGFLGAVGPALIVLMLVEAMFAVH